MRHWLYGLLHTRGPDALAAVLEQIIPDDWAAQEQAGRLLQVHIQALPSDERPYWSVEEKRLSKHFRQSAHLRRRQHEADAKPRSALRVRPRRRCRGDRSRGHGGGDPGGDDDDDPPLSRSSREGHRVR